MYNGPQNTYESLLDGQISSGCGTSSTSDAYIMASFDKLTKVNYVLVGTIAAWVAGSWGICN